MNAIVENAVQTALQTEPVTGLPVIPGTEPAVKSEAELYAEHRAFLSTAAEQVIEACEVLADAEKKVRQRWWHTLHAMASKCTPGNGKQFGREFDAVRQEILDHLAKRDADKGQFTPSGKADTLGAKWKELEQARSGFSTFSNYASQTRTWIETVKASVDQAQSAESFGQTVRNFYTDHKAKEKEKASKSGTTAPKTSDKPEAPQTATDVTEGDAVVTVPIGLASGTIRVKGEDGKYQSETVNFPTEVQSALAKLHKEILHALHEKCPVRDIVAALQVARDMIGDIKGEVQN